LIGHISLSDNYSGRKTLTSIEPQLAVEVAISAVEAKTIIIIIIIIAINIMFAQEDLDITRRLAKALFPNTLEHGITEGDKKAVKVKSITSQVQEKFGKYGMCVGVMKDRHKSLCWLNDLRAETRGAPAGPCQNNLNNTILFHCKTCFQNKSYKVVAHGKWGANHCLEVKRVFFHDSHQEHANTNIAVVMFDYDEIVGTTYDKIVDRVSKTKYSPVAENHDSYPPDAVFINGDNAWNNSDDRSYLLIEDDGSTKDVEKDIILEEPNPQHAIAMLRLEYHVCATFNLETSFAKQQWKVEMKSDGINLIASDNMDAHHELNGKSIVFGGHMMKRGGAHGRGGEEACLHQMQHTDLTPLKDVRGKKLDVMSLLEGGKAGGLLPGTIFLPLGPDGREIYIQHPMRRQKVQKGQYLYFDCNTTHGGITYEPPKAGEKARWYPALHLHLDSSHIERTLSSLNYDTKEAEEGYDYFPPEHHRAADFKHLVQHASKASFALINAMESLKKHAETGDYLGKTKDTATTQEDWDSFLVQSLEDYVELSTWLKTIVRKQEENTRRTRRPTKEKQRIAEVTKISLDKMDLEELEKALVGKRKERSF
jgi:hypothetical protein